MTCVLRVLARVVLLDRVRHIGLYEHCWSHSIFNLLHKSHWYRTDRHTPLSATHVHIFALA